MEINWKIDSIQCSVQVDEYDNVVSDISWRVFVSQDDHSTSAYGSCPVVFEPSDNFIPYEELTEEEVLQWLFDAMGEQRKLDIENSVKNELQHIIQPTVVTNPLPWATE